MKRNKIQKIIAIAAIAALFGTSVFVGLYSWINNSDLAEEEAQNQGQF